MVVPVKLHCIRFKNLDGIGKQRDMPFYLSLEKRNLFITARKNNAFLTDSVNAILIITVLMCNNMIEV